MGFSLSGALTGGLGGFLAGGPIGGLIGAGLGGFAGGEADAQRQAAADAAARGQQASIAEQRRQFDITQENLQPFLQGGQEAQNMLFNIFGGGGDPLLQRQLQGNLDMALKAAQRRGSAGGYLGTGQFVKDATRGLAGTQANLENQRINQLLALRGGGQSAGVSLGNFGQTTAQNVGQGLTNIGGLQAGLNIGKANSIDNMLNQAAFAAPFIFKPRTPQLPQTGFSSGGAGFYG